MEEKKYSIIIPHKNSTELLYRLLASIPDTQELEVIVVDDNSEEAEQQKLRSCKFKKNVNITFNLAGGGAGASRNIALNLATGKWVIFADADDMFTENLLELLESFYNAKEDIIYFGTSSVYNDTSQPAFRHQRYLKLVTDYLENPKNEDSLRYNYTPPWGKMIRRKILKDNNIRFDEILTSNDVIFSITSAYHAKTINATSKELYVITVTKGSLTNSYSLNAFNARFITALKANDFLRSIGKHSYQQSVLYFLAKSHKFGFLYSFRVVKELIKHRSNILIGLEKILKYRTVVQQRENPNYVRRGDI